MIALKRADWDLGAATLHLTDDDQKAEILAEAEKEAAEAEGKNRIVDIDEEERNALPSYILSVEQNYFSQLFQLLLLNNVIARKVWELLLVIPTR